MVFKINLLNKLTNIFLKKSNIVDSTSDLTSSSTDNQIPSAKLLYNKLNASKIPDNLAHNTVRSTAQDNQEHLNTLFDNYIYFLSEYIRTGDKLTPVISRNATMYGSDYRRVYYILTYDSIPLSNITVSVTGTDTYTSTTNKTGVVYFDFHYTSENDSWTITTSPTEIFDSLTTTITGDPFA